ncbi:ATP-binding protein [Sphingomonas sp. GCM10030256]|uniref:ATP-binding protein n=1 Tax=Sphingomonas sp. GCM10030256 TaxID=3273427 RepID=UPI00360CB7EE
MDAPLLALTRPQSGGLPRRSPKDAAAENMRQLVQLRWLAAAGQLVAILVVHFGLGVALPIAPMLGIIVLLALANLFFAWTLRRYWVVRGEILLALLLDMVALTAQLYLSGGAGNPFVALFLLQVVLGSILLSSAMVWLLVAAGCLCLAFLSQYHRPLVLPDRIRGVPVDLPLIGEWISFAMVAVLLVLFITRISRNLRARDAYVAELGQRAAEEDGIVRMGLFASGAAHELGTPLSSLSVLLSDWRRHPALAGDPQLSEELAEAQAELRRCTQIVANILHSAGQARGEAMQSGPARTLLGEVLSEWRAARPGTPIEVAVEGISNTRIAADPSLRQAIWSLLENAAEESPGGIELHAEVSGEQLIIAVLDRGPGFSDDQLSAVGRLYQSNKGPGRGLGLFLAANVARRLGGSLEVANREDGGAVVRLILPAASTERLKDKQGDGGSGESSPDR